MFPSSLCERLFFWDCGSTPGVAKGIIFSAGDKNHSWLSARQEDSFSSVMTKFLKFIVLWDFRNTNKDGPEQWPKP